MSIFTFKKYEYEVNSHCYLIIQFWHELAAHLVGKSAEESMEIVLSQEKTNCTCQSKFTSRLPTILTFLSERGVNVM